MLEVGVLVALDTGPGQQIDRVPEERLEFVGQPEELQAWRLPRLERHEQVDIAVRPRRALGAGTEQFQLGDVLAPAEVCQPLAVDVQSQGHSDSLTAVLRPGTLKQRRHWQPRLRRARCRCVAHERAYLGGVPS